MPKFHRQFIGVEPFLFREDFCGSGKIACEWVKKSSKNRAVGLDIDQNAIKYAETVNKSELSRDEQSRVKFIQQNVSRPTREKFDLIGAYNFSFFVLHERTELLNYFKAAHQSLKVTGTFFLDVAGGTGFLNTRLREQTITLPKFGKVHQIWEQSTYDPITSTNKYAIHFMLPSGECLNDAFVYNWRIWQIRELREILKESGFDRTIVLWEGDNKSGGGNEEYYATEAAANAHSWVAYLVGIKSGVGNERSRRKKTC